MKALTLWQPWASLTMLPRPCYHDGTDCIVEHPLDLPPMWKTIETRSWRAPLGLVDQRIAIHAAVRWPKPADMQILAGPYPQLVDRPSLDPVGHQPRLPLGAIIGTAVVDACVPMVHPTQPRDGWALVIGAPPERRLLLHRSASELPVDVTDQAPFGIYEVGRFAWLLADPIPCNPITIKGAQGLWNVPAHLEERLRG